MKKATSDFPKYGGCYDISFEKNEDNDNDEWVAYLLDNNGVKVYFHFLDNERQHLPGYREFGFKSGPSFISKEDLITGLQPTDDVKKYLFSNGNNEILGKITLKNGKYRFCACEEEKQCVDCITEIEEIVKSIDAGASAGAGNGDDDAGPSGTSAAAGSDALLSTVSSKGSNFGDGRKFGFFEELQNTYNRGYIDGNKDDNKSFTIIDKTFKDFYIIGYYDSINDIDKKYGFDSALDMYNYSYLDKNNGNDKSSSISNSRLKQIYNMARGSLGGSLIRNKSNNKVINSRNNSKKKSINSKSKNKVTKKNIKMKSIKLVKRKSAKKNKKLKMKKSKKRKSIK
jgi:hypothetical protein